MGRALLDTTVLFAAAYPRDQYHEAGLDILRGVDTGPLPEGIVLDYVLAETLNGLGTKAGSVAASDFLDRLEANAAMDLARLNATEFATAKSVFRSRSELSFVDAALVTYAGENDVEFLYSFDDDFDGTDEVRRLDVAENPFD